MHWNSEGLKGMIKILGGSGGEKDIPKSQDVLFWLGMIPNKLNFLDVLGLRSFG
jgi:hypothetical protein